MAKVMFQPAGDSTRVEFNVQPLDHPIVVEAGFETDDPAVIAACDNHPQVERSSSRKKGDG